MAFDVKRVEYFKTTVGNDAGDAARVLSVFASAGVSLLAFKAESLQARYTQFTLFPDNGAKMTDAAKGAGLTLDGPHYGVLVQGGDESGALAAIFAKLSRAGIRVDESSGIANIRGGYGVVLCLKQDDCDRATAALAS